MKLIKEQSSQLTNENREEKKSVEKKTKYEEIR